MSMKSGINRIILIFGMVVSILSCAFKGDGEYKKSTNWLLFYPVHGHHIKFKEFSLDKNSISYTFENVCSRNMHFTLHLKVKSEKPIEWSKNTGIIGVTLSNEKEGTVFKSEFQFNNKNQLSLFQGYDGSMQSYLDLTKNLPSKHILLGVSSDHKLGCEKYTLNLSPELPNDAERMFAQLELISSWK